MEDVEVPAENLLGEEGKGFVNFMKTLDNGRIGIAALSLGIAEGAFEQALQYTTVRKQFGQPIAHFQGVQFQLSDIAIGDRSRPSPDVSCGMARAEWPSVRQGSRDGKAVLLELAMRATIAAVRAPRRVRGIRRTTRSSDTCATRRSVRSA